MASLERLAGDRATRSKAQADDAVSCKVEPTERPSLEVWTGMGLPFPEVEKIGTVGTDIHVPVCNVYTFSGAGLPMAGSADGLDV